MVLNPSADRQVDKSDKALFIENIREALLIYQESFFYSITGILKAART
jgi:hypothetical protein